tara:strand:+ start:56 stop:1330 length:1275 start_codon:yes stop_codon:yes gene_type:complete
MIEIVAIFIQIFFITILCFFPKKIIDVSGQIKIVQPISIIYISILLLFLSFVSLDLYYVRIILIIIFLINLFFLFKEKNYKYFINYRFMIFFTVVFALSLNVAVDLKLGWDAQNYWFMKSLNFTNGGNILDLQNFPRPDYPHFGSYLWALFRSVSILDHEYFGRIFYLYIFLTSIYSILNFIEISDLNKTILFLLVVTILNNNYLLSGYQEILVFTYAIIIGCIFLNNDKKILELRNSINLLICFFIIFWIKNEGIIFSFLFLISIIFLNLKSKKKVFLLIALFTFIYLFKVILAKIYGLDINLQSGNYENFQINNLNFYFSLDRILLIFKYIIISFIKVPISIILIVGVFVNYFIKPNKVNKIMLLNFTLCLMFVVAAYIFTNFPIKFHLVTSIDRLIFELAGFNFLILVILLNNLKIKKLFD